MPHTAQILKDLWQTLQMPDDGWPQLTLAGRHPAIPSSFDVTAAAQCSIAAAALAACEVGYVRGLPRQPVSVDSDAAIAETSGLFSIDGVVPATWAALSGLYQCRTGWVRLHANFDHHRDAILTALDLPGGKHTEKSQLAQRLLEHDSIDVETRVIECGGAAAAVRNSKDWQQHPQALAIASLPLIEIEKIGDASPRKLPAASAPQVPLSGIRALDLTRILAGPVAGRTLAAYGADVMLVNSPTLPNIEAIADTSRGKLSALIDLQLAQDRATLDQLLADSHLFIQGYRPGSLAAHGLAADELGARFPGIVCVSLSAYGRLGPWCQRRGFDSLVQTAAGFNLDEAAAAGAALPTAMPVQILDYASGFLMACGASVALYRQQTEGGSWHVQVSLARTAQWLRSLGQQPDWLACEGLSAQDALQGYESGYGLLEAIPHAARLSGHLTQWRRPSSPPGTHAPVWPAADQ